MVEQEAVNFEVAGSSPVPGATQKPFGLFSCTKSGLVSRASRSVRVQSREPKFDDKTAHLGFFSFSLID